METKLIPLRPYRQTWLTPELLHKAPSATLVVVHGKQMAQLTHPLGGPLTCVENRTGKPALGIVRKNAMWHWEIES